MATKQTRREVIEAPRKAAKVSRAALFCHNPHEKFHSTSNSCKSLLSAEVAAQRDLTKNQRPGTVESIDQRQNLGEPNFRPQWQADQQAKKTLGSIRPSTADRGSES
jgi:hypothetical protein